MDKTLRIGTFYNSYALNHCAIDNFEFRKGCTRPGMTVEILRAFLDDFRIVYELVPYSREQIWRNINGTWTNMLFEDLKDGYLDTLAQFYFDTKERRQDFSFTSPVTQESLVFLVNGGSSDIKARATLLFTLFDHWVWLCLLACIIIFLVKRIVVKFSFAYPKAHFFHDKQKIWSKMSMLVVAFTSVLFYSLYRGFLLGQLIYPPNVVPIKDIPEMIDRIREGNLKLIFDQSRDFRFESIAYSDIPLLVELREALKNNPPKEHVGYTELYLEYLPTGEYAYPISSADVSLVHARACKMVPLQSADLPLNKAGLMFKKDSNWTSIFNLAITKLSWHTENIVNKYHNDLDWQAKRQCSVKEEKPLAGTEPLSLITMSGAFYAFGLLVCVAGVVLLIEILSWLFGCKRMVSESVIMNEEKRGMSLTQRHSCAHQPRTHRVMLCDECLKVIVALLEKETLV